MTILILYATAALFNLANHEHGIAWSGTKRRCVQRAEIILSRQLSAVGDREIGPICTADA